MGIALLDVAYTGGRARAGCVIAEGWTSEVPEATYVQGIEQVQPYQPGRFYLRELPGLLAVLHGLPSMPDTAVVDGYVWLPPDQRPGLGAHLYEALGKRTPVVGIAKTAFAGSDASPFVAPVLRGTSRRPLYVTAVGMELAAAADAVRRMAGGHRIPELVRLADALCRGTTAGRAATLMGHWAHSNQRRTP